MKYFVRYFLSVICCFALVVTKLFGQTAEPLFKQIDPQKSGLQFLNTITETDSLHVFRYEYLYNGAGVGVGDFNRDGLEDLFFSGNLVQNKLFLNKGALRFEDITGTAGVQGNGTWSTGVTVADVNGDGWLDIYVCHSGKYADSLQLRNELFINEGAKNGKPTFRERAVEFGLDAPGTQSTQAVFFDYDLDGDLDMFLLNHSNHTYNPFLNTRKIRSTPNPYFGNRFFRNNGIKNGVAVFEDITQKAGIINHALNFGLSVTVSDLNNDGWPDLYTTSDYTEKDCLYINKKNGTFAEQLEKSMAHISKYSMGADIADINNDGWTDLFTLDMLPEDNHRQKMLKGPDEYDQYHLLWDSGYYKQQMRNMLQLNQGIDQNGNLRFSEIGQLAGLSNTDWSWSGLFADFDLDGWKDAFVTNGYLRDYTDLDFMKYTVADARIEAAKNGHQNFQTHALVVKMPSNKLSNYVFRNNGNLTFSNKTAEWGLEYPAISNAAVYADLDNDGDLDLVVMNNNDPVQLFENTAAGARSANYLAIRLGGNKQNLFAIGARVELIASNGMRQLQELYPVRGYQSSQSYQLVFGLPANTVIDTVKIRWPDQQLTYHLRPELNKLHTYTIPSTETISRPAIPLPSRKWMEDISSTSRISFRHKENDFIDFKDETLLPYMLSRMGPALATADVNGDGLDDVFIGAPVGQSSVLYLQKTPGRFELLQGPWSQEPEVEEVQAAFFDADGDGDPDLYIVSGGNEYGAASPEYQDRLYINDGKGIFHKATDALPSMLSPKQGLAIADFDKDGDLDIWVGGMYEPGSFPLAARSWLLRNDSQNGAVRFTDITAEYPFLLKPGANTAAVWADINSDGFPELILAGDWMRIQLIENNKGKLVPGTATLPGNLTGWWRSITADDLDGDGDIDFILGNAGINLQFKASEKEPVELFATDIDQNGTLDPLLTYYIGGKSYPAASRDELLEQVVPLRKKFVYYKNYADVTVDEIIPAARRKNMQHLLVNNLSSGILWNEGKQPWKFDPLPLAAQVSSLQAALVVDWNKDGKKDIYLGGNFEAYRVQIGQSDASYGLLLQGAGNRLFEAISPMHTGVFLNGDVRQMKWLNKTAGQALLLVAPNNGPVQVIKINQE
ncbi:VCBS repeat-containing protein [Flavihumibacter sp. CACIAM 22H1]|uniref:VCBS repeat-containing protein n=1 Tax=Flavihumibacter sp. CACIAM 22H1 TaxID=1812911 RepID=UPI000A6BB2E4|nr:VCBS repeat-containing protein [Flavihumibacter sp. CACIAM 22H1]